LGKILVGSNPASIVKRNINSLFFYLLFVSADHSLIVYYQNLASSLYVINLSFREEESSKTGACQNNQMSFCEVTAQG